MHSAPLVSLCIGPNERRQHARGRLVSGDRRLIAGDGRVARSVPGPGGGCEACRRAGPVRLLRDGWMFAFRLHNLFGADTICIYLSACKLSTVVSLLKLFGR